MSAGDMVEFVRYGYITRVETFCASHRLHNNNWTDEKNRKVFGKCNNPNGHGHNYRVEVMFKGPINHKSGMIINLDVVKQWLQQAVHSELDHKNLDKDVSYFKNVVSTTENLAVYIWKKLKAAMGPNNDVTLREVKIYETDKNIVTYRGE